MNKLSWLLYFAEVSGSASVLCGVVGGVMLVGVGVLTIVYVTLVPILRIPPSEDRERAKASWVCGRVVGPGGGHVGSIVCRAALAEDRMDDRGLRSH